MRSLSHVVPALLLCALLGPALRANQAKPPAGPLLLGIGESETIKIVGFGGCKFGVAVETTDAKVVDVSFKEGTAKSQKVTLEALSPGEATVTITTEEGTNPGCQGFEFEYTVTVSPDLKLFEKAAKTKFKEQLKATAAAYDMAVDPFCTALDELVASVKSGEMSVVDGLDSLEFAYANLSSLLNIASSFGIDTGYVDLWNCPEAQGFTQTDETLVGYLPGGCGPYDEFMEANQALLEKFEKTLEKKLKKAIKELDKIAQKELEDAVIAVFQQFLGIQPPQLPAVVPAPVPQVQPPAPAKQVERTSISSGRLSSSGVTRLKIGGVADPASGMVTVEIEGPDGAEQSVMVMPDDDCAFCADFSGIKPGNYKVKMTQGDQTVEFNAVAA